MQDIAPQLLEAVMQAFRKNLDRNSRIKDLQEKLLSGKLTGSEADLYAVEVGQALAKAFHDEINSDTLPDGKMYYNIASRVIPLPLRACYEDVADYAEAMYQGMNERAKLGIKAQRAKYSTDREKGLIEYACGSDDYSNRQKNFEGSLVNYAQSVATDTMKENAEFQYQAGLSPVIRRSANGGCCEWCAALAGVYPYEEVRATGSDVYRRHRDCRCTVTYDPGDGKVQDVHTKRWEAVRRENRIQRAKEQDLELRRIITRRAKNLREFSDLEVTMQKRVVKAIARRYGIDIKGLHIKIQRNIELLRTNITGITDYDHIGRIDLLPKAFLTEEELVRTVLHEKCHVKQLKKYGKEAALKDNDYMEKVAYRYEEMCYNYKKRKMQQ